MNEDFVTRLRLQLRDAADRDARRSPPGRLWQTLRWDVSRPALAVAGALALAAVLALVAVPYLRSDERLPAGRDLRITADTQLLRAGGWLLPAYGSVWAGDTGAGAIVRVDPGTRAIGTRIPVGGEAGLGAAAGWLWVTAAGELLRIDPASGEISARMSLGPGGLGLPIAAGDAVWLIDGARLRRVDPARMVVDRVVRLEHDSFLARSHAVGPGVLYVQGGDARVVAFDAASGDRLDAFRLRSPGTLVGFSASALVLAAEDGVATIDPETGAPGWIRRLGVARVNGVVMDDTTVWVQGSDAAGGRDRLWRLDALDGRVLGSVELPGFGVAGMAVVGGDAWIVTPGGQLMVVAPS